MKNKVIIKKEELTSLEDFIFCVDMLQTYNILYDMKEIEGLPKSEIEKDDFYKDFIEDRWNLLSILGKIISSRGSKNDINEYEYTQDVELSKEEAKTLRNVIEYSIFDLIRDDEDISNITWLNNIMKVWNRCQ